MRFVIRHEGKNRLRVHMKQSRMTYEQADVLLYYLEGMEEVVRAQVYSQTPVFITVFACMPSKT